jgi:LuxR family maltose regulon positive regulatory protein
MECPLRQAGRLAVARRGDSDPVRFLAYLIASLRTVAPDLGAGILEALDSSEAPPTEAILTALVNEIAALPGGFVLILDDYHLVDAEAADRALAFLIEHLPPRVHVVIATRPVARTRPTDRTARHRPPIHPR